MKPSQLTDDPEAFESSTDACVMIDARYLNGKSSGIGRYTEHLIGQLLSLDSDLRLELITHPARPRPIEHERVHSQTFYAAANSLSTRYLLSRSIDFSGVDLFHSPFNILPADLPVPALFTLHDIMWVMDPNLCTPHLWKRLVTGTFYQQFIPRSVREAASIMTVSESSRAAIAEYYPDAEKRIHVSYNGLDPFFRPTPPQEGWPLLSKWLAPRSKFVLIVGQGAPYKNHTTALRGFVEVFGDDPSVYCVLVRRLHARADKELRKLLADPRLSSRVIQLDYISGEELRALYSLAQSFLFPSLYEGFGLPALEAMACGTAVVTSAFGAPAEVCGEAAVLVDPTSPTAIAEALARLHDDPHFRALRETRGRARAASFRWRSTARRTLAVYRRLLTSSHARSA